MKGQTCYSYAMGIDENVLLLERDGFEIKKDGENYCVSFGIDLADTWEEFCADEFEKRILERVSERGKYGVHFQYGKRHKALRSATV